MNNEVWYVLFYSLFLNKIYINFVISCDESARECLRVTNIIWVLAIEYSISMPLWLMSHLRTIIDAFLWTKYWTVRFPRNENDHLDFSELDDQLDQPLLTEQQSWNSLLNRWIFISLDRGIVSLASNCVRCWPSKSKICWLMDRRYEHRSQHQFVLWIDPWFLRP